MARKFRRVALYATMARYAAAGVVWWVQRRHSAHEICGQCGGAGVRREPSGRGERPLVAVLVDEYAALLNAVSRTGTNYEAWRRVLEPLLAPRDPLTVTVADPKHASRQSGGVNQL